MNISASEEKEFRTGTGLGGLIAGIIVIAEKLFARPSQNSYDQRYEEETKFEVTEVTVSNKRPTATQFTVPSDFSVERGEDGRISVRTIRMIFELIIESSKEEFAQLTIDSRQKRRETKTTSDYVAAIERHNMQLEGLLEKKQRLVLDAIYLDEKEFESTMEHYFSSGNQEVYMLTATLPQCLMLSIPSQKELSDEGLKNVVQLQIDYLTENTTQLKEMAQAHGELGPHIIQQKLHDFVFEKLGVEEEDVTYTLKQNSYLLRNPEFNQLMMSYQNKLSTISMMQS